MNKTILITGANSGLGKESARQFALLQETEKVILACRNPEKAESAKRDLEESTGKNIFEILIMDVSKTSSVREAVAKLDEAVDALVMNAGGMGGKNPERSTLSGMNEIAAQNLLGHAVLVDELIEANKISGTVMFASSEAARGIKKMGIARPVLSSNSSEELASVLDGSYFKDKMDPMVAYAHVKYIGTLWMSSLSRKHPSIKFVSISPGATSGTSVVDNASGITKFMFKYIMMPFVLPIAGMVHKPDQGAARYLEGVSNNTFRSGGFYASNEKKVTGPLEDQFMIYPTLANTAYQDNAYDAIHRFVN